MHVTFKLHSFYGDVELPKNEISGLSRGDEDRTASQTEEAQALRGDAHLTG